MKLEKILLWFISVLFSCNGVLSLNILGVFPYPGKSHFFVFEPYLRELARRGHNLTVISYFPQQKPLENYHDISLAGKTQILEGVLPVHRSYWSIIDLFAFIYEQGRDNCKVMLEDENVQNLWKTQAKFDVIVLELFNSDCSLGLAYKLGGPIVGVTSHMLLPWQYEQLGIQYNPSYVPLLFLEGGTKPSLYERIERILFHAYFTTMYKLTVVRPNQNEIQKYFDDVPPLRELASDVKFTLLYTNYVLTGSRLFPSNVKEVGGFHVAKPKPLPADLKKFIDESRDGVIFISFGSMLRPDATPQNIVDAIVETISKLPQRIIWKWDAQLPRKLENAYISKWLPQNDILAHPNVRAFYSHCGMLSTTEAIYHGVPMIGMPVFGDQPGNAGAIEESGLGVVVQIRDLTAETLLQKFKTVLDPEFKKNVSELSRAWHDTPLTPMDNAIYWTELAARTKNLSFKSPSATVPFYQYLYLDILAISTVFIYFIYFILKVALSSLVGGKSNQRQKKVN